MNFWKSLILFLILHICISPNSGAHALDIKIGSNIYKFKEICGSRVSVKEFIKVFDLKIFYDFSSNKVLFESKSRKTLITASEMRTAILDGKNLDFAEVTLKDCNNVATISENLIKRSGEVLAYPKAFDAFSSDASANTSTKTSEQQKEENAIKEIISTEFSKTSSDANKIEQAISSNIKTIIIDPGHGGDEKGTVFAGSANNKNEITEKAIALSYAEELTELLRNNKFNVILTRTKDETLPLDKRVEIANTNKADLYISLHVNHSPSPKNRGFETYILSLNATDDEARQLAIKENSAMIKNAEKSTSKTVTDILTNIEQNVYLQESANIASKIHNKLLKSMGQEIVHNRGVKQAMFYVLHHVAMPAVLVEVGFLSNATDRKYILDDKFKTKFIQSLANGIIEYRDFLQKRSDNAKRTIEQKRK